MNFNNIVARKDNRLFPVFENTMETQLFSRDSKQLDQHWIQASHVMMQLHAVKLGIIIKLIENH